MSELIDQAFEKWTEGRDELESRIEIFENVRDITYAIVPNIRNFDDGPDEIIAGGRGSCTPKHFLLGRLYERLGLDVRYASFPFYWNDPDVKYPDDLRKASEDLPKEYHLACRVKIDDRWVLVDATWDLALEEGGYPVNRTWDGCSDTKLAVRPLEEILHEDAYERDAYVKKEKSEWTDEEHARAGYFYDQLNLWLEAVRTRGL